MIVPTLLDSAMMSVSVIAWVGCECESWNQRSETRYRSGTDRRSSRPMTSSSNAAAAVMTLLTDPGS